jgi:hypothetical protein
VFPPEGREVLFQLGPKLLPELVTTEDVWMDSDKVGNGTNVPLEILTVGTELFPLDVVPFQLGPTLPPVVPEPTETETVGTDSVGIGTKDPVPEIPPLGAVILEFHPVKVPVGRVPLSTGLDVKLPGIDHGSESLVVPDLVIRVSDGWDVTPVLDWRVWVWLLD